MNAPESCAALPTYALLPTASADVRAALGATLDDWTAMFNAAAYTLPTTNPAPTRTAIAANQPTRVTIQSWRQRARRYVSGAVDREVDLLLMG